MGPTKNFNRNIVACIIGNTFEWYDFILFGALATTLTQLFFPEDNFQIGLLKTYGLFAAGFIMRPLGSLILGFLGDKLGRKPILIASILLMAIPTTAIGLLPTYKEIGFYAPIFLMLLRLIQGFAMGGEYSGSMVFLYEHAPEHKKGFYTSWVDCGCLIGVLCGTLVASLVNTLSTQHALLSWGWRLPFIISAILGLLAFYFRKNFQETKPFLKQEPYFKDNNPSIIMKIFIAVFVYAFGNVGFYLLIVFLPNYLIEKAILTSSNSFLLTSFMSALIALAIPFAGYLSDKIGRLKVLAGSILLTSLISIPLFMIASSINLSLFIIVQIVFSFCLALFYGGEAAFFSETFPPKFRFLAVSLSLSLSNIFFGGGAPLIAEWISQHYGDTKVISLGVIFLGGISLIGIVNLHSRLLFSDYKNKRVIQSFLKGNITSG